MGKGKFKLQNLQRITTADHTCKSMWRCDNVGGLGKHVTCHMFWILSRPFFFLYYTRDCVIAHRPMLTISASHDDVFSHNDVPLWGPVVATSHLGYQVRRNPM